MLLADTRQVRAIAAPDLVVRYRAGAPLQVSGTVTVPEADIHLERLDMGVSPSPDVVVLDPVDPKTASTPLSLQLDLTLAMGGAVKIDGYGMDGSLGGSLRVQQQPGRDMRATGTLEVDGRYRAYGQNLKITRGTLLWANSEVTNPRLIVRAEREVPLPRSIVLVTGAGIVGLSATAIPAPVTRTIARRLRHDDPVAEASFIERRARLITLVALGVIRHAWALWATSEPKTELSVQLRASFAELKTLFA